MSSFDIHIYGQNADGFTEHCIQMKEFFGDYSFYFISIYFQYLHNLHPIDKSILVSQECLHACKTAKIKNREIIIRILFHFGNRKKV